MIGAAQSGNLGQVASLNRNMVGVMASSIELPYDRPRLILSVVNLIARSSGSAKNLSRHILVVRSFPGLHTLPVNGDGSFRGSGNDPATPQRIPITPITSPYSEHDDEADEHYDCNSAEHQEGRPGAITHLAVIASASVITPSHPLSPHHFAGRCRVESQLGIEPRCVEAASTIRPVYDRIGNQGGDNVTERRTPRVLPGRQSQAPRPADRLGMARSPMVRPQPILPWSASACCLQ